MWSTVPNSLITHYLQLKTAPVSLSAVPVAMFVSAIKQLADLLAQSADSHKLREL
jgi:hypothetical protein